MPYGAVLVVVPETTMHEHNLATTRKDNIRFAREPEKVKLEPVTGSMQQTPYNNFGFGIF